MKKTTKMSVQGSAIAIQSTSDGDFISLTDIARHRNPEHSDDIVRNWLRNRNTVEFLGVWEMLHNPDFNSVEFDGIKSEAGLNSFGLTPKRWIESTRAIGIRSSTGRYGGTFAHRDIAFEFASWVSVEFKLYLIKEFQRLKEDESRRLSLEWNLNRTLSKLNYRIHTDAIKEHIIPNTVTPEQVSFAYASEADLLNVALFGHTAKQWRDANPGREGNVRDYASVEQLLVLANIEGMNAEFIRMGLKQSDRLKRLNVIAITQLKTLTADPRTKALEAKKEEE
jgi:hypothetical protein